MHTQEAQHIMRYDLDESLNRSHIRPSSLSTFQRILLTTDGTLTDILEAYLFEPIQIVKLSERLVLTQNDIPELDVQAGSEVIDRKILLKGKISRKNFVYAQSIIVPDRLEESFRDALLNSQEPIGRLWREKKMETFKEIIDSAKEPAAELGAYFRLNMEDNLLFRTYRVFSARQPIMSITEKFPESYFVDDF